MYRLETITAGKGDNKVLEGVDILCGDSRAAVVRGGLALMISAAHAECGTNNDVQHFLHGVVLAIAHCAITESSPTMVDYYR